MSRFRYFAVPALSCALSLSAQTYQPKTIQLQGADSMDHAEVMRLIGLEPGTPVTKEQIESAMQRMADSGLFADLSYTVTSDALVFVIKPVAGAQAQPVRFSNFVWWQPGELETLVEARVPLFLGRLPLTGQLTTQVEAALVSLLSDKGVADAKVDAMQSRIGGGLALTIMQPQITLGEVHLTGTAPEAEEAMNRVTSRLASRDFDIVESSSTIVQNTLDMHRNAGYLDVTVDRPVFSPPHKSSQGYAVDASATVHPGGMYRIGRVEYDGLDPKLEPEVARASGAKSGDPAGEMALSIAEGLAARALQDHGRLEAKATADVSKDPAAHTAVYRFHVTPGPVYRFASVDVSALPAAAQRGFQGAFHVQPGQIADADLRRELMAALHASGSLRLVVLTSRLDRTAHTVAYVIAPKRGAAPADGAS